MPSHVTWSRQVKEKAGFVCQYCGTTDNLESHHIKPVYAYPNLQFDISNGVCLCRYHHRAAHGGSFFPHGSMTQQIPQNVIDGVKVFLTGLQAK